MMNTNAITLNTLKEDRLKFIQALFDEDDQIAFGDNPKVCNKPIDPIPYFLTTSAEQFCINPLQEWRKTENVTNLQSLLFEVDVDADGNKMEEDLQEKLFLDSGMPFTTMVSSGNKSVHVIVRFTKPFTDGEFKREEWHKAWWNAIAKALLKYGINADERARLVTQISRVPGSVRSKTGQIQTLKHIRDRVSPLEMYEWLKQNDVEIIAPKPYVPYTWDETRSKGDSITKWQRAVRWTERKKGFYSQSMTTGLHDWLFTYGGNCFKNELEVHIAQAMAVSEWGTHYTGTSGTGLVEKAVEAGWKWMSKQN